MFNLCREQYAVRVFECVFQMKSTGTHVEVLDVARRRSFC